VSASALPVGRLYIHAPIIGISANDGFEFRWDRPARHCRICGESFQPTLARSHDYDSSAEIQWAVEIMLQEWATGHNKQHTERQHRQFKKSRRFLTPEATIRLAPMGIIPVQDMVFDEEVAQAGLEAPRAPFNDAQTR
jgi:hypothetical protein